MNGKPSPLTIRAMNRAADMVTALSLAGLDDDAIMRILRSLAEATFAGRPAVPPRQPYGYRDGQVYLGPEPETEPDEDT